jgi:ABC-type polysaccharide/polyol phosphate export permease
VLADLKELWNYRELLHILVQRDLKARYKNSALGFGWSLINPLVQVVIITLVIQFLMGVDIPNYHAYVFCATLPWLFFSTALMDSSFSLVGCYNLIRRTYFPRELVPLVSVTANVIHFLMATAVFLAYMAGNSIFFWLRDGRWDFSIQPTVFLILIPMAGLTILVAGISMFLSVWTLYFEDVRYLLDSALKILYWVVPVIYFPEVILHRIPGAQGFWVYCAYMLNPLSVFLTAFRKLTLAPTILMGAPQPADEALPPPPPIMTTPMGALEWLFLGIALLTSVLVFLAGQRYFNARKWKLAERP